MGAPIDFSYIKTHYVSVVEGYFHCTRFGVSRQDCRHGQICLLNQTRPKIFPGTTTTTN